MREYEPHEFYDIWDANHPDEEEPERWCDQCGWYVADLGACLHWDGEEVDAISADGYSPACEEFSPVRCVSRSLLSIISSALERRADMARRAAEFEEMSRREAEAIRAEYGVSK